MLLDIIPLPIRLPSGTRIGKESTYWNTPFVSRDRGLYEEIQPLGRIIELNHSHFQKIKLVVLENGCVKEKILFLSNNTSLSINDLKRATSIIPVSVKTFNPNEFYTQSFGYIAPLLAASDALGGYFQLDSTVSISEIILNTLLESYYNFGDTTNLYHIRELKMNYNDMITSMVNLNDYTMHHVLNCIYRISPELKFSYGLVHDNGWSYIQTPLSILYREKVLTSIEPKDTFVGKTNPLTDMNVGKVVVQYEIPAMYFGHYSRTIGLDLNQQGPVCGHNVIRESDMSEQSYLLFMELMSYLNSLPYTEFLFKYILPYKLDELYVFNRYTGSNSTSYYLPANNEDTVGWQIVLQNLMKNVIESLFEHKQIMSLLDCEVTIKRTWTDEIYMSIRIKDGTEFFTYCDLNLSMLCTQNLGT